MYGLVNRAFQQMDSTQHGEDVRQRIKDRADLKVIDVFFKNQAYPDDGTHRLVALATVDFDLLGA